MFSDDKIVITGSGANRQITLSPEMDQFGGPLPIRVTVGDGTLTTTEVFTITVIDTFVDALKIDDGTDQRSAIRSIELTLDRTVEFVDGADPDNDVNPFELRRRDDNHLDRIRRGRAEHSSAPARSVAELSLRVAGPW